MKSPNTEKAPFPAVAQKEQFFDALENDGRFMQETLEVILNLVISDPVLTFKVGDLIESDFKNLYLVLMKKVIQQQASTATVSCCKDL
ncbi:MAG: hypothetical protein EPO28_01145 [Saprospiraceae bacterium]|nr:MAG: hypothetical protein EPO28_01145 [Saprospiraceae bacterium]